MSFGTGLTLRWARWAGASVVFMGLIPGATSAQRSRMSEQSLLAVPGVFVEIEGIDSVARSDGLNPDSLRLDIEGLLRDADIRVLTRVEWQQLIGNPTLALRFELLKASRFIYIYRMSLELRQLSVLVRDTTKLVNTATWTAGSRMGSLQVQDLAQLRGYVPEMVQWFIDDYLSVRGSREPPPRRGDIGPVGSSYRRATGNGQSATNRQ